MFNLVLTSAKLGTLGFIIILAFTQFDKSNFTPFFVEDEGFGGTVLAASLIFYGFLGFDFITTLSDESKRPVRDIPTAVRNSTLLCLLLYLFTSVSLAGMAPL